ncbi:MAG: YibE/F family protein [Canibacter sp.]
MHAPSEADREAMRSVTRRPWARTISVSVLSAVAIAIVAGMVALWPDYSKVAQVAGSATNSADTAVHEKGEILGIEESCEAAALSGADGAGAQNSCLTATVGILSGKDSGQVTSIEVRGSIAASGLKVGDRVELAAFHVDTEEPAAPESKFDRGLSQQYTVSGVHRGMPLLILGLIFVAVLVAVGRLRGLLALVALALSAGVLFLFVLPALLTGGPGLLIGVVASAAIMLFTLYFVHGPTLRTTSALIGTLAGIGIMALISLVSVNFSRLSGIGDESSGALSTVATELDFTGLLSCAILIAGLGVLNDVTITQASSVWELRAAAPMISRAEIFSRAMRIGRDHIASTVYTVFFAYVGAALSTLMLMYIYNRSVLMTLSVEEFATEIVRTIVGSVGLILAVPITTWVATLFLPAASEDNTFQ